MVRAATKLTSTVKKSNGPGALDSDSVFQFAPSRFVDARVLGAAAGRAGPCPTSTATTWRAPWRNSASVKPPVDAPTSTALAPRTSAASANRDSAASSLRPPRLKSDWLDVGVKDAVNIPVNDANQWCKNSGTGVFSIRLLVTDPRSSRTAASAHRRR